MPTKTKPDMSWQVDRPLDVVRKLFTPDVTVTCLSPHLAGWTGVVAVQNRGPNRGQHIKVVQATSRPEQIDVFVRWTTGSGGVTVNAPVTGWYSAKWLDPA